MRENNKIKLALAILIAAFFLYLTLRNVDISQTLYAIEQANRFYLLLVFLSLLLNLFLRAIRWQLLLKPLDSVSTKDSFVAVLIGYAGNIIFPAHFGELFRVQAIGKKSQIRIPSALATIAVERMLDIFCFLILFFISIRYILFPDWIYRSGKILSLLLIFAILVIIFIKRNTGNLASLSSRVLNWLPQKISDKIKHFFKLFFDGFEFLKDWSHNLSIIVLSVIIWLTHLLVFKFAMLAFGLKLGWNAAVVVLVITTLSAILPLTPGYVGSFHFLSQLSLEMFHVSKSVSTAFAFVLHAISTFPFLIIGIVLFWIEGIKLKDKAKNYLNQ